VPTRCSAARGDDIFLSEGNDLWADTVKGDDGFDTILGNAGDDVLLFKSIVSIERIDGGGGRDILRGVGGNFWDFSRTELIGIVEIDAADADDIITGSAQNDRIIGGPGNDSLDGGAGIDTAVYRGNFAAYTLTAVANSQLRVADNAGTDGIDTIRGFEILEFADGSYSYGNGVFTPFGAPTNTAPIATADRYAASKDQALLVNAAAGVLSNDSDPDGDTLTIATFDATSAHAGLVAMNPDGSFTYTPRAGFTGSDSFSYTASDGVAQAQATVEVTVAPPGSGLILLEGTTGHETLDARSALSAHEIRGLAGDDVIFGSGFADLIVGGPGADQMFGGAGDDIFLSEGNDLWADTVKGDDGFDTILGNAGDDVLLFKSIVSIERIDGGGGRDILRGVGGNFWDFSRTELIGIVEIDAADADDIITGSAQNDRIIGGPGNDSLDGGAGIDTAVYRGNFAAYTLTAVANSQLRVADNAGTDGIDTIRGFEILEFADGSYSYGNGVFTPFGAPTNTAPIATADRYATSKDQALLVNAAAGVLSNDSDPDGDTLTIATFDATSAHAGLVAMNPDGSFTYTPRAGFTGSDSFSYTASDGVAQAQATVEVTVAPPGSGLILLEGTTGHETLDARSALSAHEIRGLAGDDVIFGSGFADLIVGGPGADQMFGGAGDDIFLSEGNDLWADTVKGDDGFDTILGNAGDDVLLFKSIVSIERIDGGGGRDILRGVGGNFWDFSRTELIGIVEIDAADADDIITGSAQNDRIIGGPGNDSLDGGAGIDTAVYRGNFAAYTLTAVANSQLRVADNAGTDGIDTIRGFEILEFADGSYSYGNGVFTPFGAPTNTAPIATADRYATSKDQALLVNVAAGVLSNDSDPDGDTLTIATFDATSAHAGLVAMNPDGSFTYTPRAGFTGSDSFSYTASDGVAQAGANVEINVSAAAHEPMTQFQTIIADLPEGEWIRLNLNKFQEVWTPDEQRPHEGVAGDSPGSIIVAWGAATWDSNRDEYLVWGGGHANYGGNEVYTWSALTLLWERASLPSAIVKISGAQYETVDGYLNSPISSHAYDNLEFLQVADRMINFGGAAAHTGAGFVETDGTTKTGPYFWDPSKADPNKVGGLTGSQANPAQFPDVVGGEMWENRGTWSSASPLPGSMVAGTTDYALIDGQDVVFVNPSNQGLYAYTVPDVNDPSQDTWELLGNNWDTYGGHGAGAYDPDHNIYVRTSRTEFSYWDLDNPGALNRNASFVPSDASGKFVLSSDWGMEYDPVREQFVLWNGDSSIWFLRPPDEPAVDGWSLVEATAPSLSAPTVPAAFTGVIGKWDYVDAYDVFVGVTDHITGDIWAYKPEGWVAGDWLI
jgi:Ca2+-binding RTX toxin-like protein